MGLFDRLADLFGRSDADAVGRGPAGEVTDATDGDDPRRDPSRQSHGSHWDTVVAPADRERAIQEALMWTVEEGTPEEAGTYDQRAAVGYRDPPDPVGATVVTLDGQVATGYPVADGVTHDCTVTGRTGWESGVEAWVALTVDEAVVTCFDTGHYAHRGDPPGGETTVSLSVLLYSLGEADPDEVVAVDESGAELDPSGMAGFFPYEDGAPDDYAVRTTVSEVSRWEWRDTAGYRIRAPLFRTEAGEDVDTAMYVADHNCADGYEPETGDDVEGLGWLQGQFG